MCRDSATLTLAQWLSPAFPVGAFAYSTGLERAVADGLVSPETLEDWLLDMLDHGTGRSEALLIRAAAQDDPAAVDAEARAFCASRERLAETKALGSAFCAQLRTWGIDVADLTYPVAFGHAVGVQGYPIDLAIALYLQAWVSNAVACAQRLMPLGQTEGQRIVAALTPVAQRIAQESAGTTLDDLTSQTMAADIAAMRHETQEPRIFRT
ncbi:urease accessory protein UreF [Cognatishimia sp. F0-27]|nr:urease accessory protein UreF [Cognatishimia sp. F0-27]